MFTKKIIWYGDKLANFIWVCFRLFLYFLIHPREAGKLGFTIFSSINEFYQISHGGVLNFEKTSLYRELVGKTVFAQSNLFNRDSLVTRSMETHFLSTLVVALGSKRIFEIGTYNGFTTMHLALNSPADGVVYTLDLPGDLSLERASDRSLSYDDLQVIRLSQQHINARFYKHHPVSKKIVELFGDSSTFDFSPYYGKMKLILIDGNHSYDFVKRDTENALKMLSPDGVIVWHDFDYIIHKDVFLYLKSLAQSHAIYAVPDTRFALYGRTIV